LFPHLNVDPPAERCFLLLALGHDRLPAGGPLDVVAVVVLPAGEDLQATAAQADLGAVGVGGAHAADGGLVGALSRAGALVQHQRREPRPRRGQRRRDPDAAGTDHDDVVARAAHGSFTPARAAIGASTNSGRRTAGVTDPSGTPSSRNSRAINGAHVFAPHAPMPARATTLISFTSRYPCRISARSSPAVTRSQRQTMASSSSRST